MADPEVTGLSLEPITKSVIVRRTPNEAFDTFTRGFGSWWPYTQFSIHQDQTAECAFEPRLGGELYEVSKAGERAIWGTVVAWEPPHRLVLSWHPGHEPAQATEVELRFEAVPEGTRVTLEHRDWAKLGAKAAESREAYENGWVRVFETCYLEACS